MRTRVINLISGPGVGKSTMAAEIFSKLKRQNKNVELVREYAKDWAWDARRIEPAFQAHIFGEQTYRESRLYGKVNYLITDSPLSLCAFYQERYTNSSYLRGAVQGFYNEAINNHRVVYWNIFLERDPIRPYRQEGRFEDQDEASAIDHEIYRYVDRHFGIFYSGRTLEDVMEQLGLSSNG